MQSLTRNTAEDLEDKAPEQWLWKGRHVNVVDGTTVSMPDTESNQRAFLQPKTQARGVGFPLARLGWQGRELGHADGIPRPAARCDATRAELSLVCGPNGTPG